MEWININPREKPHRCRKPRIRRRHGNGSTWQCDDCAHQWELHRVRSGPHWWNLATGFCIICGPALTDWTPPHRRGTSKPIDPAVAAGPVIPGADQ